MSKNIVFMGTPDFSLPTLEALIQSEHKILAVYSQPPSKANRGQKIVPSKVESFAKKNSLNLRTPSKLDTDEEHDFFKNTKPDLVVVVAYGKIIPKRFLSLAKNGFINIHASLLPKWRGAAPIQRSIMNLDSETGISIMKIVEKLDAGPIIHQAKIKINENIDSLTLSKVLSKLGAKSIIDIIKKFEEGDIHYKEQDHNKATYAKKISKNEGQIRWDSSAKKILAKINGLNPNPGAWFEYKKQRYKVWKAKIENQSGDPGKIIDNKLMIACKDGAIKILEIQKQGKSKQKIDQFLMGNKIKQGDSII
tara:strand:- start:2936 stop:3856 length:921 start_codon:yes stop_codon:yes gene_type:complete